MLGFYARKQLLLQHVLAIAILSVRPSVCLTSVTQVDLSKTVQSRIIKFSPSAARKTLVSGTVKLLHKLLAFVMCFGAFLYFLVLSEISSYSSYALYSIFRPVKIKADLLCWMSNENVTWCKCVTQCALRWLCQT